MHSSLLDDVMFTIYHVNTAVLLVKITGQDRADVCGGSDTAGA
jgi:hypothetical protein